MATQVQIELTVDEKGAVQGVRQFSGAVQASNVDVKGLDATLQRLNTHLDQLGQRAKQPFEHVNKGAREAKEGLHLATEELDIRMPRAFRNLVAQSKLAQTAIEAIGPALIGLGAIEVGVMVLSQLYTGAKELYEKWLDVDGAIERYNAEAGEAASKKFYEDSGLDQLKEDLVGVNAQLDELAKKKELANKKDVSWSQFGSMLGSSLTSIATLGAVPYKYHFSTDDAHAQNINQGKQDTSELRILEETHKKNLQRIEDEGLIAQAKVIGISKARLAQDTENKKADEEFQYRRKKLEELATIANRGIDNKRWYGDLKPGDKDYREAVTVSPNAGKTELSDANEHSAAEFQARQIEISREQAQELMHMREAALEAGLRGSALYHAQEAAAIEDLKVKGMNSAAFRDAVHLKFHNEQMKRLQDETREVEKIERTASVAGTTGIARTRIEGVNRLADIRDETFNDVDASGQSAHAERERKSARETTNAEILTQEQAFTDRIKQLSDESATHQISGFARIRAEAQKQINALTLEYQKLYGKNVNNPDYQAHIGDLNRGVNVISSGADQQERDLARRNADETAQIEAEARAHALSAEKQQTAAIQAEYEERLRKYTEELKQQEISQDDFNRRAAAAAQLRDAQMVEAAKAAREKMAGEFTRFFKDPLGSMKEMGEKAAGEAAAAMVQRMQNRFGGQHAAPDGEHGALGMPDLLGGLWGRIAGLHKGQDADRHAEVGKTPGTPQSGLISLATAQIRIGSAVISGSAVSSAAVSIPGVGNGSTSLLPGSAFNSPGGSTSEPGAFGGGFGGGGFTGGAGEEGAPKNVFGNAIGTLDQGVGIFKQAKGIFAPGSGGDRSGTFAGGGDTFGEGGMPDLGGIFGTNKTKVVGPTNNGMLGGGGFMANAGGAAGGAMGLFAAYQGNGGVGGALGGAMSGMELGMAMGGPIGAGIGLAAGAILGAIGFGGREKARVYDLKTVRPRLGNDKDAFQQGSMDYLSAYSDMQALDQEARTTLGKMGGSAKAYYWDTINGEIKQAEAKLTAEQRAGRSQFTSQPAQYDIGTDSVPRDGWGIIHKNERIVPSSKNERMTRALERGADMEAVHRSYMSAMNTREARQQTSSSGDRTLHMNVNAIDARGVRQFFQENKHHMRAALNDSYAENSGGADA